MVKLTYNIFIELRKDFYMKLSNPISTIRHLITSEMVVFLNKGNETLKLSVASLVDDKYYVSYCKDFTVCEWIFETLQWKDCGRDVVAVLKGFITEDTEIEII